MFYSKSRGMLRNHSSSSSSSRRVQQEHWARRASLTRGCRAVLPPHPTAATPAGPFRKEGLGECWPPPPPRSNSSSSSNNNNRYQGSKGSGRAPDHCSSNSSSSSSSSSSNNSFLFLSVVRVVVSRGSNSPWGWATALEYLRRRLGWRTRGRRSDGGRAIPWDRSLARCVSGRFVLV